MKKPVNPTAEQPPKKTSRESGQGTSLSENDFQKLKDNVGIFCLLDNEEYKDKKNLIKKLQAIYGNEDIFKYAMLKLQKEHEKKAMAFGLYFGFQNDPLTLSEIGKIMNLSKNRVGILSKRAFKRLNWHKFRKEVWEECGYKEKEKET